ncbi:NifU family protein [Malacoplasma muris]|uniref:NifU family protein n=1 Tax=Malacoplasma muris TaxID=2119 RepID=UPI00398F03C7
MKQKIKDDIVKEIEEVIESIRFYINQDGGDLEFIDFDLDTGVVSVRVLGACVGCALIDLTYKDGVETILKAEVPEVKEVKIIEEVKYEYEY